MALIGKRRVVVAAMALMLLTGLRTLACEQTREPVVRFIDIYLAAERAEVPGLGFWDRIVLGLAAARSHRPAKAPPQS